MKPISEMSQIELAAYVNSKLTEHNITVVLSGGAAVAYRSNGRYVSADIDLVNSYAAPRKKISEIMSLIGFTEEGRQFVHPDSKWTVEFPAGPLGIGDEHISKFEQIPFPTGVLNILSATDSVKDRLAWFYYDQDQQCLQQAVWITNLGKVDLADVERWSVKEGQQSGYAQFLQQINEK